MEKKYLVMPIEKNKVTAKDDGVNAIVFLNLVPTILWGIIFVNQFFKDLTIGPKIGIWLAFVVIYMILHFVRFVAFLPAIANTILIVGMLWVPCNWIPNPVIKIIVKVIVAAFFGLFELSVAVLATINNK